MNYRNHILLAVLPLTSLLSAQSIFWDPSFGSGGIARDTLINCSMSATVPLVLPDDRILLAGAGWVIDSAAQVGANAIFVSRLLADGALDTGFGNAGHVVDTIEQQVRDMKLLPDGRFMVLGESSLPYPLSGSFISRYLPNGTPDSTYGINGKVLFSDVGWASNALRMATGSDGSAVVHVLNVTMSGNVFDSLLVKFGPDGSLDTAFGTNGRLSSLAGDIVGSYPVVFDDGSILAAHLRWESNYWRDPGLIRYQPNGIVDTTYGTNGQVHLGLQQNEFSPLDLKVRADGGLILVGTRSTTFPLHEYLSMVSFTANGEVDGSFGVDGMASYEYDPTTSIFGLELVFGENEDLYVTGIVADTVNRSWTMHANANGAWDGAFGEDGSIIFTYDTHFGYPFGAVSGRGALQTGDRIIVCGQGYTSNSSNSGFAVMRLLPAGGPDLINEQDIEVFVAAYPNPLRSSTTIRYALPHVSGHVALMVRDVLGSIVRTERLPATTGAFTFNSGELTPGVYVATLLSGGIPKATLRLVIQQ
jgi:uncharacterized delta-60 repeat protein